VVVDGCRLLVAAVLLWDNLGSMTVEDRLQKKMSCSWEGRVQSLALDTDSHSHMVQMKSSEQSEATVRRTETVVSSESRHNGTEHQEEENGWF
jgi:hypothetical protein